MLAVGAPGRKSSYILTRRRLSLKRVWLVHKCCRQGRPALCSVGAVLCIRNSLVGMLEGQKVNLASSAPIYVAVARKAREYFWLSAIPSLPQTWLSSLLCKHDSIRKARMQNSEKGTFSARLLQMWNSKLCPGTRNYLWLAIGSDKSAKDSGKIRVFKKT